VWIYLKEKYSMLKKLVLRNFQNHKSKTVVFDKYVTILTGENDAGKTASIRGLGLVLYNRPLGRSFITHGRKRCSVQLFFDRGNIKRVVGKDGYYSLNGKKFKAFGNSVPPEIASALSVAEINLQSQHSPLFWFGLTPGQTAKELNKLVDLESIDKIQSTVAKKLRDKRAELKVARKRLDSARRDCSRLRPIKKLDVKLGKLELRQNDIALKSSTIDSLALLVRGLAGVDGAIDIASKSISAGLLAAGLCGAIVAGAKSIIRLESLMKKLSEAGKILEHSIPLLPPMPPDNRVDELRDLLSDWKELSIKEEAITTSWEGAKMNLDQELGGRCPSCGGILSDRMVL
jgi:DNA repair exonuclease SbcCD ATPase subunit